MEKPAGLRGVNLGGWLVVEKWMTPSLFEGTDAIDQYTLVRTKRGPERLRRHIDTFITEADFAWLAAHGINAVRLPVGFWALHDVGPQQHVTRQLDWVFRMGKKYKIAILLCLHAAPGSQNGNDHSGRAGRVEWYHARHRRETYRVLREIAERYTAEPALWGIELLNEPKVSSPWHYICLRWWTWQTASRLRRSFPGLRLVSSDAFAPDLWSGKTAGVMDVHHYQAFSESDKRMSVAEHLKKVHRMQQKIRTWQRVQPVIIGEWSLGLDEASLHGVPRAEAEKQFGLAQLDAYAVADAWFFWSYKTEQPDGWNYRALVEQNVLPNDTVAKMHSKSTDARV